LNAYRKDNLVTVLLVHGETDWLRNVLAAGEAQLETQGRRLQITNPRVLPAGADGDGLPRMARLGLRRMGVLVADIA
jgi:hypothetical protein